MYAAIGILLALLERERSGVGQWVHASLLQSLIVMMDFQCARYLNEGDVPVQEGNHHPLASPMGTYRAADGWFNLAVSGSGIWARMCKALGKPEWIEDPRFASNDLRIQNRAVLNDELERVFATHPRVHWVEILNRASVPAGPTYSVPEVFEDPQVKHLQPVKTMAVTPELNRTYLNLPVQLERTPPDIAAPAPAPGQHTDEVLEELGLGPDKIAELRKAGVI
jgi:crotonobetainyl-CoA:carnitine CoA-transferase CaiB-like acyl-CoA transferase